jgi:hypothetical protein
MKPVRRLIVSLLTLGAMAFPTAALADHPPPPPGGHGWTQPRPPPPPIPQNRGRYELRTVDRWVEGYYVSEWVPEQCIQVRRHGPRHKRVRCEPGYDSQRWVPGHYQQVEEWVWVPAPRPQWHVSVYR